MQNGKIIAGIARLALGTGFFAIGILGIVRALAPVAPIARLSSERPSRGGIVQYAGYRVGALRAALHSDPNDPELHLKIARSYNARATVLAHQEYSDAFPDAFLQGRYPASHYDSWRRGWFHCDRDGDLRRALHHARRAIAKGAPRSVRLASLQVIVNVLRQRCSDQAAINVLEQIVSLAPDDPVAWFQLSEAYRAVGDVERYRLARHRLDVLQGRLSALPFRDTPGPKMATAHQSPGRMV